MNAKQEPEVATKVDIANVRTEMAQLETRLVKQIERVRTEVASVKFDLLKWLVPIMLGQSAAMYAVARLWGG